MRNARRAFLTAALVTVSILRGAHGAGAAVAPAASSTNTVISNTATLDYKDTLGASYRTTSNTITAVAVNAIVVTPKEAAANASVDGYPTGSSPTLVFTIQNAGNLNDSYVIANVTASAGTVASIVYQTPSGSVPVQVGRTVSPTVAAGGSLAVAVTIATAGVPTGTAIAVALTAQSQNGGPQIIDTGNRFALTSGVAVLSGPGGTGSPVQKTVNGARSVRAAAGATVSYAISFENSGTTSATNVVLTDPLPAGITIVPASVKLNGAPPATPPTLSGQTLTQPIASLPPTVVQTLMFDAVVNAGTTSGATFVNVATVRADGVAAVTSQPASVSVGSGDIVFDGYGGAKSAVAGASVALVDPVTLRPIVLAGPGVTPNAANADPFTTGGDGRYDFGFGGAQIGSAAAPAQYLLTIAAPKYRNRRILVSLQPDAAFANVLYNATLTAIDGQSLAAAGDYALVDGPVTVHDIFGLLGNLPMFAPSTLTIAKSADRQIATAGDRIVFTVPFSNTGKSALGNARVVDTMPPGLIYATGTGRLDNVPVEPKLANGALVWSFPSLASGEAHQLTYATVVTPNVPDGASLTNVVTVGGSAQGATTTATATATVAVSGGAFSSVNVITGRVFVDVKKTGFFTRGDSGVPGVRIYLEDGESVLTDRDGRFSFPGASPGMHVLRLDPTTFPPTVRAFARAAYDSPFSSKRLVHGILDAGMLRDVNFALEGTP